MFENKENGRRWLIGLVILATGLILAWRLEKLSTLVLLSFLVAYVLNPVVTRLGRIRLVNRLAATLITLLGVAVLLFAVVFVILPEVISEFRIFLAKLPVYANRFQTTVVPKIEESLGIDIPLSFEEAFSKHGDDINHIAGKIIGPLTDAVTIAFGHTFSAVFAFVGTLMFPLFLFFLLKDFPNIVSSINQLIPPRNRNTVHDLTAQADANLSAFLHGQFMVMIVLGTLYSVGYSIVGIPVALGVGLLTGMLCFIPYVGAATGFLLALLMSLLAFDGFDKVAGVVVVFAAVQLLDAVLITPKILGGKLGLTPLWIIIALMAGGELFGFLGVLLAVPTTAVLKVVVSETQRRYLQSKLYLSEKSAPEQ